MIDFSALEQHGFLVASASEGPGTIAQILQYVQSRGCELTRDVKIGMEGDGYDLNACPGDFWFHTDGCFLPVPPHYVITEVLEADQGGELFVLDSVPFASTIPSGLVKFGDRDGFVSRVLVKSGDTQVFRYREDYMFQLPNETTVATVHSIIRENAADAVPIDSLGVGDFLVCDNWRVLHRRALFIGRRVIRRLWISPSRKA